MKAISYIYLSVNPQYELTLFIKKYALHIFYSYFDKEKQIGQYIYTNQSFCSVWRV